MGKMTNFNNAFLILIYGQEKTYKNIYIFIIYLLEGR
jgi:hypothetical protein